MKSSIFSLVTFPKRLKMSISRFCHEGVEVHSLCQLRYNVHEVTCVVLNRQEMFRCNCICVVDVPDSAIVRYVNVPKPFWASIWN